MGSLSTFVHGRAPVQIRSSNPYTRGRLNNPLGFSCPMFVFVIQLSIVFDLMLLARKAKLP